MSSWTQPICEDCFKELFPRSVNPARLKEPELERCCICGDTTQSGLYVHTDSKTVPYPTLKEE